LIFNNMYFLMNYELSHKVAIRMKFDKDAIVPTM